MGEMGMCVRVHAYVWACGHMYVCVYVCVWGGGGGGEMREGGGRRHKIGGTRRYGHDELRMEEDGGGAECI